MQNFMKQIMLQWLNLAKKDVKKLKKKRYYSKQDFFTVGQMTVEVEVMQDWINEESK